MTSTGSQPCQKRWLRSQFAPISSPTASRSFINVRVHFERKTFDAVIARVFGCILPVRDDFFFPLPVLHLSVLGRPTVGDPVGLRVLRRGTRAARKTDDDFHIEHFREKDGVAEGIDIFLGMLGIGMNGVAVATERGDANSSVFKLFLPGFGLGAIGDELVQRAMTIVWIAS